ncbi:10966_t:CDS:2 [Ambispora leptoticha]|uniref:10966_t:CDS:1 n=1 Tax=Ambispora leptoticha TaxID=144679 RepID=A0A9N8VK71_9GLOM|nr:10966_t:CDS:2 [Ambispora leptoticha]
MEVPHHPALILRPKDCLSKAVAELTANDTKTRQQIYPRHKALDKVLGSTEMLNYKYDYPEHQNNIRGSDDKPNYITDEEADELPSDLAVYVNNIHVDNVVTPNLANKDASNGGKDVDGIKPVDPDKGTRGDLLRNGVVGGKTDDLGKIEIIDAWLERREAQKIDNENLCPFTVRYLYSYGLNPHEIFNSGDINGVKAFHPVTGASLVGMTEISKLNNMLLADGVDIGNRLTPAAVQELHRLGYLPIDIVSDGSDIKAYKLDKKKPPLNGIKKILAYHKGWEILNSAEANQITTALALKETNAQEIATKLAALKTIANTYPTGTPAQQAA